MTVFWIIVGVALGLAFSLRRPGVRQEVAPWSTDEESAVEPTPPTCPPRTLTALSANDLGISADCRLARAIIDDQRRSLFLTGRAGTGKSTFLVNFRATTKRTVTVLAPTGLAAITVGGQTIHSFFKFPPRLLEPDKLRPGRNAILLRRLDVLVIDEVSMVRVDLMDSIDRILRLCRGRLDTPFGGVQVLLIGDLFQLPPVVRGRDLKDYFARQYGSPYFFHARAFRDMRLGMLELQTVYRQRDPAFLSLLNSVRNGTCTQEELNNPRLQGEGF